MSKMKPSLVLAAQGPHEIPAGAWFAMSNSPPEPLVSKATLVQRTEELEVDTNFLQFVSYVVLTKGGKFWGYFREGGEEQRLRKKFSCGVGGHVEDVDFGGQYGTEKADVFRNWLAVVMAARRELREEVGISPVSHEPKFIGTVYDDTNPVGSVHVGFVFRLELSDAEEPKTEKGMVEAGWLTAEEYEKIAESFPVETWTKLVVPGIAKAVA